MHLNSFLTSYTKIYTKIGHRHKCINQPSKLLEENRRKCYADLHGKSLLRFITKSMKHLRKNWSFGFNKN